MTLTYSSRGEVAIYFAGQVIGTAKEVRLMIDRSGNDRHTVGIDRARSGSYTCEATMTLGRVGRQVIYATRFTGDRKKRGPKVRAWIRRLRAMEPTGSGRARRLVRAIRKHEAKLRRAEQWTWWSR